MKTLEQIKNDLATKHKYLSWANLIASGHLNNISKIENELLILVQKECLKNAEQQLSLDNHGVYCVDYGLTNENNIIK